MKSPFLVWTDHKHLEYIRSAKRLNSLQARWSLFFTRFNFSLSCWPGSCNVKPDAPSRQFVAEVTARNPDTILPAPKSGGLSHLGDGGTGKGCTGGSAGSQFPPQDSQCSHDFQPPLFPALQKEASCPSVEAFISHCHQTWTQARAAFL